MKKYRLLVVSLLVVPFLVGCKGGDTPSVDIHVVSEQEFNDACSFKNVQYLQAELTSVSEGTTYSSPIELSPTVSHMINESSTPSYYEIFVQKKSDGSYERAIRTDKSKKEYSFEPASESDFLTPQSTSVNVLIQLEHVGLSYTSFTYDSKAGTYSASFIPEEGETKVTTTLKFENKILISDVSVGGVSDTQTTTFTYENKTPEYPENPGPIDPYIVNEDEFNAARAFTGVEYLQTTVSSEPEEGGTITQSEELSSDMYHAIGRQSTIGVGEFYFEKYVYKINENTYKILARDNETSWEGVTWVDAETEEWRDVQLIGDYITIRTETVEFDPSKYDPNTHSYTLKNEDEAEFVFKFENKKLTYLKLADQQEMNFTYNQITPEPPIPVHTI